MIEAEDLLAGLGPEESAQSITNSLALRTGEDELFGLFHGI